MKKENNNKTEDFLKGFSLKPAPPALKEKILDGALQKRNSIHEVTTFLSKGFVGCLLLLFVVIAVDATISHAQNRRFSSFIDEQQEPLDKTEEEWSMLKDIWEPLDSDDNTIKFKFFGFQKKTETEARLPERRESLEQELE